MHRMGGHRMDHMRDMAMHDRRGPGRQHDGRGNGNRRRRYECGAGWGRRWDGSDRRTSGERYCAYDHRRRGKNAGFHGRFRGSFTAR
jgi:hypothetical protein